jgi:hypothetical protein
MPLILAIESDKRQASHLTAMVRSKLHADLVLGDSAEQALKNLGDRVPDLVLTSALLSPKDEQALGDRLRRLNGVAAHVQTLTLPVFAPPSQTRPAKGGVLSVLLGDRHTTAAPDGCDPAVFAEQCREYLERAAAKCEAHESVALDDESQPERGFLPEPMTRRDAGETPDLVTDLMTEEAVDTSSPTGSIPVVEPSVDAPRPAISLPTTSQNATTPASLLAVLAAVDEPSDDLGDSMIVEQPEETATDEAPETSLEFIDVDLSELLEEPTAQAQTQRDDTDETTVYELDSPTAPVKLAAQPSTASSEDDFEDWTRVVEALKRESAQTRVPRVRRAAPPPQPAAQSVAAPAPQERRRERDRRRKVQDEWGVFDPEQAGMQALFDRLAQLNGDDDPPVRPA